MTEINFVHYYHFINKKLDHHKKTFKNAFQLA